MQFEQRIKELRKTNKLSQSELAEKLNLSQRAISHYEKGDSEPDYDTLKKIASFFNTTTDYMLGFNNDPTPPKSASK